MDEYCRHCGKPAGRDVSATPDWLCSHCQHYQDSMTCPTCGSEVRISLMPDKAAPAAHAPVKPRKPPEE